MAQDFVLPQDKFCSHRDLESQHKAEPRSGLGQLSTSEPWPPYAPSLDVFTVNVLEQGSRFYRDLPWRHIDDPYAVLVSEVMLQQTQVSRVLKFWDRWMASFPTIDALAAAGTSDVLEHWQGLGYNRRVLALKRCADLVSQNSKGVLPSTAQELCKLPGIGLATAGGVMAFAHNKPTVYLETNVRSVFIHELFPDTDEVHDRQLLPLVKMSCPERDVRRWYYALLDYGASLKKTEKNPSRRSAHYARQSSFEGSRRQKRAEILRIVLGSQPIGIDEVYQSLNDFQTQAHLNIVDYVEFSSIVGDLVKEGFFIQSPGDLLYS